MRKYTIHQVDAFTLEMFKGNPAGVVLEADTLSEQEMQQIARELNNSETVFLLRPSDSRHDVWLRFFTPETEVPLCGHATIAAHYVRAKMLGLKEARIYQETGAGILPLDITVDENGYEIVMTQAELEFHPHLDDRIAQEILDGLGCSESDRDRRCPLQVVSAGHSKVFVGVKNRSCLNALQPDMEQLIRLSSQIGSNGFFVFAFDSSDSAILTHGRMFAPAIGIQEDPVTGNGNGPLGAYLVYNNLVEYTRDGVFEFVGQQGEALDRTGHVRVRVLVENGKPKRTYIGGRAVEVFSAEIVLP